MKLYWHFLFVLIVVFLQITLFSFFTFHSIHFNFSLLPAIMFAFYNKKEKAIFWAFTTGIFLDIFSPLSFGIFTLSHLVTIALLSYFVNRFFTQLPIFLAVILLYLSYLFFEILISIISQSWSYLLFINPILATLVGTAIFLITRRLFSKNEYL